MKNPWAHSSQTLGRVVQVFDSTSRLEILKEADIDKLREIIAWPETQSSVKRRAQGRLNTLLKRKKKAILNAVFTPLT